MIIEIVKEKIKKFNFGKIDAYNIGRKINAVEIEVYLNEYSDGSHCFSVMGSIWNKNHTDIIRCGQILDADELLELESKNELFKTIKELWAKYHLNSFHAGTYEQEQALREAGKLDKYNFEQACEYLKSIGLYEVEYEGKPYRYGSGWIHYTIPQADFEKILNLFNQN